MATAKTAKTAKTTKSGKNDYYCVAVKRNYEDVWRVVSKHDTQEDAQAELDRRRAYTGTFNYDNADLRVISRAEAKKEFGKEWEYTPIGAGNAAAKSTPKQKKPSLDDEEM